MIDSAFHPLITLDMGPLHYFSVLGRALYTAQHLEMNCRAIAISVHLRRNVSTKRTSILNDPVFQHQIEKIWHKTLGQNVHFLKQVGITAELSVILEKARDSRNEIAHAIAISIDDRLDSQVDERIQEIVAHVRNIAAADMMLAAWIHVLNKDPLPTHQFLSSYVNRIEKWVTESTHE